MKTLKQIALEAIQDPAGRVSHARIISMLVAIAATVFIWKMIITGGMTVDYFIAYLAYGTGHQTLNKFLDFRANRSSNETRSNSPTSEIQTRRTSIDDDYPSTRTASTRHLDIDDFDTPEPRNKHRI